jgi:hypothetical protein
VKAKKAAVSLMKEPLLLIDFKQSTRWQH